MGAHPNRFRGFIERFPLYEPANQHARTPSTVRTDTKRWRYQLTHLARILGRILFSCTPSPAVFRVLVLLPPVLTGARLGRRSSTRCIRARDNRRRADTYIPSPLRGPSLCPGRASGRCRHRLLQPSARALPGCNVPAAVFDPHIPAGGNGARTQAKCIGTWPEVGALGEQHPF